MKVRAGSILQQLEYKTRYKSLAKRKTVASIIPDSTEARNGRVCPDAPTGKTITAQSDSRASTATPMATDRSDKKVQIPVQPDDCSIGSDDDVDMSEGSCDVDDAPAPQDDQLPAAEAMRAPSREEKSKVGFADPLAMLDVIGDTPLGHDLASDAAVDADWPKNVPSRSRTGQGSSLGERTPSRLGKRNPSPNVVASGAERTPTPRQHQRALTPNSLPLRAPSPTGSALAWGSTRSDGTRFLQRNPWEPAVPTSSCKRTRALTGQV